MEGEAGVTQVPHRCRQYRLRGQTGLFRRQECLVCTHARYVSLLLKRRFGPGFIGKGFQQRMPPPAGFQSQQGGLDLVHRGYHGTTVSGRGFVQSGFRQRNVALKPEP